jgi:hypothetical protein
MILTKANRSDDSYLEVIDGSEALEEENTLMSFEKHTIHIRCQLLCLSLHLAIENINIWTWNKCYTETIRQSQRMGFFSVKHSKTVEKWYRAFCDKHTFCLPLMKKHNLPPFLDMYALQSESMLQLT